MKKSICTLISMMVLLLLASPLLLSAQQTSDDDQVVVEKKIVDQDGNVDIEIKNLNKGESLKAYLKALSLNNLEGKDVELNILDAEGGDEIIHLKKGGEGDETIFLFRSAGDEVELDEMRDELRSLRINLSKDQIRDQHAHQHAHNHAHKTQKSKKALLGIYPETGDKGVLVTSVVSGGGAEAAGIQKGDVITALDGQTVKTVSELSAVIGQHEPGYAMKVDFLRNGSPMQVTSTLKAKKSSYSYNYKYNYNYDYNYDYSDRERDPCIVFIGVYTTRTGKGMKISKVIEGTSAENAALQRGDIITALNGVPVRSHNELVRERDKNEPGDYYTLTIINNGVATDIEAQFLECPKDEPLEETSEEEVPEIETPEINNLDNNLQLVDFNAFPNPTYGPVNVQFKGEAVPTTVRIVDATGKVVFQDVINNFDGQYNKDVNVKNAAPGTLIVNVLQGNQVFSKPLVLLPRA